MKQLIGNHIIDENLISSDFETVPKMQPKIIKLINTQPSRVREFYNYSPKSYFVLRDHPLSEQKNDMKRDPVGTGVRHADDWAGKLKNWNLPMTREKTIVCGINEPPIWENKAVLDATVAYTVAFLDRLKTHNILGLGLNLNTGHPNGSVTWDAMVALRDAILRGGHYLGIHEYWAGDGPQVQWGHNTGRFITKCNWQVPVIVGECGVDQAILGGKHSGWREQVRDSKKYADQLMWYGNEIAKDPRILGAVVFTQGGNSDWQTFRCAEALLMLPRNTDFEPVRLAGGPTPVPSPSPAPVPAPTPSPTPGGTPPVNWGNMPAWTKFTAAQVAVGQKYWRLTRAQFKDANSSGGKHHIFLESGRGTMVAVNANGAVTRSNKDIPMYTNDEFKITLEGEGAVASDAVSGLKMEPKNHHVSYHLWYELATAQSGTPAPGPSPTPTPVPSPAPAPSPAPGGSDLQKALIDAAEKNQVIRFNPTAALQKAIFAAGFVPNSGEFRTTSGGVTYVAQRAEHLATGEVRVYYCKDGDWGTVLFVRK